MVQVIDAKRDRNECQRQVGQDASKQVLTLSHKYGRILQVKTTLEIPDSVFRRAKSKAAERGIPLRQFVTEAVESKLQADSHKGDKPWMKHVGKLKDLHKETERINKLIDGAFEQIDPEMWG